MALTALLGILLAVSMAGCANAAAADGAADGPVGAEFVGRWVPADGAGSGAPTRPFVELAPEGGLIGSDGCNETRGTWSAGPDGALQVETGPSTLMACTDMVSVPSWFGLAVRADVEGDELVLLDAGGAELGRVERSG